MKLLILLFLSAFYLATSIYGAATNSPTISITPTASISEGDSGTTQLTLNITTSECPNKKDISVHWFTASNTAIEDDDFTKIDGDVTFSKPSFFSCTKTKQISIDIIGDTTHENDEIFNVNIQISADNAQHYTEGVLVSTLTITNDDEEPANTPPTIDTIPEQSAYNDTNYSLNVSNYTTDRDNDPILSYTLTGTIPNGLNFNSTTGILSGAAYEDITSNLSVYATDKDGNSNTISFTIVVSDDDEESEPINNADDLCYDTVTTNGFCTGMIGFMCTITTPIKNINNDALTDVQVILASTNMFSAFSDCGVDGVPGDCNDSSQMSMMSMSALNYGVNYSMPNYTGLDSHTTYTSAMFSFLTSSYEWLAKYTKNGTTYQGVINPCGTVVEEDPIFEACGIFPSALNTWDTIYAENNDEVIYADAVNANNGVDGVVGCSDHPLTPGEHSSACSVGTLDIDPPGLPNFINSTENSPYSASGISTLTNAQYGDVTVSSGSTITFSSDTTYTDNSRKIMLIKSLTVHENTTLTFDAGDYYIGEWSSDKRLTVRTNGLVRFFINGDMLLSDNFLDFNYNNDTGTPANMFIFVDGNFAMTSSGGGSGYNMVAFVFTNGTFNAGTNTNNSSFRGAITAVGSVTLNNNQTYTYDANGLDDYGFGDCNGATYTPTLGRFDAWQTSILDREITTKIVDKPFNLTLASLTDDFNSTLDRDGITIKYKLYDYDSDKTVTNGWEIWNITTGHPTIEKSFSNILKAYKDVRVRFKYCQEISTSDIVDYARCYDDGHQYYEEVSSSDNFAIRPDRFELTLEHSHLPNLFRSGSEYNLNFNAHNYNSDINTTNYNQSQSNINVNESVAVAKDGNESAVMNGATSWGGSTLFNISNGSMNGTASITFSDVGKLNLIVKDKVWASVDSDDTTQDCSTNGAFICGDKNITFIPHHFGFKDTNITNYNISDGNFTYLSNLDKSNQSTYKMSARIATTIVAQNESNATTKNFQSGNSYYENPLDINATISDATHGDANTTSITNTLLGFTLGEKIITRDETNLSKVLRFNFPHQINNPINPFIIDATDLNLSTTSTYTQTPVTGYDSSANVDGNENGLADGNATFIYGRTNASRQTFEASSGSSNIYFEVYCFGDGCDKDIIKSTTSPTLKYTNDIRWYINENHNSTNDGVVGTISQKYGNGVTIGIPSSTNPATVTFDYNENYGYPYKTTIENNASSWLIYNKDDASATKNSFQVEFIKVGKWTGENETNTTTKNLGTAKINRRTIW